MSDYQQYLAEREKIDYLIQQKYRIKGVLENLSGAFVQFEKENNEGKELETLHILTPEARKYFSFIMMKQSRACSTF